MSSTAERIERTEYRTVTPMPSAPGEPSVNGPFPSLEDAQSDATRIASFPAGYKPCVEKCEVIEIRTDWLPVDPAATETRVRFVYGLRLQIGRTYIEPRLCRPSRWTFYTSLMAPRLFGFGIWITRDWREIKSASQRDGEES